MIYPDKCSNFVQNFVAYSSEKWIIFQLLNTRLRLNSTIL